jgi:hypothetical protein
MPRHKGGEKRVQTKCMSDKLLGFIFGKLVACNTPGVGKAVNTKHENINLVNLVITRLVY